jgi:hypothetical protein
MSETAGLDPGLPLAKSYACLDHERLAFLMMKEHDESWAGKTGWDQKH